MGVYKHLRKLFQQSDKNEDVKALWRERLIAWRKDPVTVRVERPTRLDRARALGYKAKQGVIVVRQRVKRGGHKREHYRGGRRSRNLGLRLNLHINYQRIAEERANKRFVNCEVLGSYFVVKDGKHFWYEVILLDRAHPVVLADKRYSWVGNASQRGRVHRGLTSAGRKGRGLRNKGKGAEKVR